jgi:hypothetical protein
MIHAGPLAGLLGADTAADTPATWPREGAAFYDSAAYQFPEGAQAIMEYADGPNTWAAVHGPGGRTARQTYPYVHSITVEGGTGSVATRSLVLDYESGLRTQADPELVREWAEARIMQAHRAVFYCNRANLHQLLVAVGHLIWTSQRTLFWIPTLDGAAWSAQQLAEDIALHWGVAIPANRIWACQHSGSEQTGGDWDASTLLGQW